MKTYIPLKSNPYIQDNYIHYMQKIINKKTIGKLEYDNKIKEIICTLLPDGYGGAMTFSKDKAIKRIMDLEKELFMPEHIPRGTKDDPLNPDFRVHTKAEMDKCSCSNCKYPYEYWIKRDSDELKRSLRSLEELKANPV